MSVDRSGPDAARHHRPRRRATSRSPATGPRSCTTSRRSRTSASRGPIPTGVLRVNVEGTAHVLDAARAVGVRPRDRDRERRGVRAGRGPRPPAARGRAAPARRRPYGVSKIAASYLALQAHLAYGLDVVRVRAFAHTGPGQSDRFLVPALAQRIAAAEREERDEIRVGSLDPVRDLSDVRDVVRAVPPARASAATPGEVYNVCSGAGVSVGEIAEHLVAAAAAPAAHHRRPRARPARSTCPASSATAPEAARRDTGWAPEYRSTRRSPPCSTTPDAADAARSRSGRSGGRASRAAPRSRAGRGAGGAARSRRSAARRSSPAASASSRASSTRHDVVGAAVHEQPRARRDVARPRRSDRGCAIARIHAVGIGRIALAAQHAGAARVLEEPLRLAHPRAQRRGRREGRDAAHAVVVGGRRRSRASRRAGSPRSTRRSRRRARRSASTAARTSASQPSIEKSPSDGPGAAEGEREPGPARLARDAIAQASRRCCRARRRRPTPRGNPGSTSSAGTRVTPGGRAKCALEPQAFRDDLLHRAGNSSRGRERVVGILTRVSSPTQIKPSTCRRARLEGMGRDRARAPRGRADHRRAQGRPARGRPPLRPARRAACWLYPTAEHQQRRAAQARVPALGRPRDRVAGRRADHGRRLGRRHRRRDDHRGRAPRRDRLEAHLDRRVRVVAAQVEEARPAVGARAAGRTGSTSRSPCRGTRPTAAAPRGSTSAACPPTRRPLPSHPALSDVAFESKQKGVRESLPAECWAARTTGCDSGPDRATRIGSGPPDLRWPSYSRAAAARCAGTPSP